MTYIHPNLSEHYGPAFDIGSLTARLNDAGDHIELAAALYDATALPPIELRRVMQTLARREGAAPIETAHELTARRLRALLKLDVEEARIAARAFADAHIDLPDAWQERGREIELSVIKNALHVREFVALTDILPWLRRHESAQWLLERLDQSQDDAFAFEPGTEPAFATA